MDRYRYAILYHNYYSLDGIDEMRQKISALDTPGILLLCSLPDKFAGSLPPQTAHEKFVISPNLGKDIGGKLLLMQLLFSLAPETPYTFLLHDKRSYQKQSGRWEKEGLFSILEPEKLSAITAAFDDDPNLGIACASGYIRNEYLGDGRFDTTNSDLLGELMKQYAIPARHLRFVGGTMFCIRTALLRDFFPGYGALEVRATLESGNVLDHEHGTRTHCWERMLSWVATSAGYKIKEF
ncbi:MAG TPA: rhamnan synthesis F family protein [Puia sp.]|nr:rhamnan synthesis F family protein [Puia sp.]